MSSGSLYDAWANVHLLARCILLLRVSINLAQQAHATGTARRLRRALRTARGAQRAMVREANRASCIRIGRSRRRCCYPLRCHRRLAVASRRGE